MIPCLLRLQNSHNSAVAEGAREALALVGYVDAVHGRGVRVLSLDGGGTKYVPISNLVDFIDRFIATLFRRENIADSATTNCTMQLVSLLTLYV